MERKNDVVKLTATDHMVNSIQACLLGIPVIGASLERLCFGGVAELRMKRVEKTLREIGETLKRMEATPTIEDNEDFANLLETVLPPLSRATTEGRRERFRDLLVNAAQCPPGDPRWADAKLAAEDLEKIDDPGLAIIAGLQRLNPRGNRPCSIIVKSTPPTIVHEGNLQKVQNFIRENEEIDPRCPHIELGYSPTVTRLWIKKLDEMELTAFSTSKHDEPTGGLTDRGLILVEWTITAGVDVD